MKLCICMCACACASVCVLCCVDVDTNVFSLLRPTHGPSVCPHFYSLLFLVHSIELLQPQRRFVTSSDLFFPVFFCFTQWNCLLYHFRLCVASLYLDFSLASLYFVSLCFSLSKNSKDKRRKQVPGKGRGKRLSLLSVNNVWPKLRPFSFEANVIFIVLIRFLQTANAPHSVCHCYITTRK